MPHFEDHHPVRHRAEDLFALVADIERYPEFVPLCQSLVIRNTRQRRGRDILIADMTVGYKAIRETFTCQVVLDGESNTITASYIDGPFRFLENRWHFEKTGERSSIIHFVLDYEFKSRALASLMGAMFDRAFAKFVSAFEARADELYGKQEEN
ncbi:MAG: type II toxin-antitoxin system RatA family toxin [Ahrensia sp.]|nr:type II toxin-antitoxin system RatA family toxin [Ahrensia sp.]